MQPNPNPNRASRAALAARIATVVSAVDADAEQPAPASAPMRWAARLHGRAPSSHCSGVEEQEEEEQEDPRACEERGSTLFIVLPTRATRLSQPHHLGRKRNSLVAKRTHGE